MSESDENKGVGHTLDREDAWAAVDADSARKIAAMQNPMWRVYLRVICTTNMTIARALDALLQTMEKGCGHATCTCHDKPPEVPEPRALYQLASATTALVSRVGVAGTSSLLRTVIEEIQAEDETERGAPRSARRRALKSKSLGVKKARKR
jgi:hypothetical protein